MQAIRFHEFGGPEVLRLEEVEEPRPGPGEVALRVTACGLNHLDVDVREGVSRFPVALPHTPGMEAIGTIEELGPGVEGWRVGERVAVYLVTVCRRCRFCRTGREPLCVGPGYPRFVAFAIPGGFAERMVCEAERLIRVPDALSDAEAASVQAAFGTSWHMLFDRAKLQAGETILVNSVGSGIASAAVQLAKMAGAFVIGTSSGDEKLARARALGLDVGINYRRQDVVSEVMKATDGRGVEVVYEHTGGDLFLAGLESLAKDGRLVTCGAHGGEVVAFDIIPFFRTQKAVMGSFLYTQLEVERCFELAGRGRITPLVYKTFPLAEAAEAMATMERREHFGKIVLRISA